MQKAEKYLEGIVAATTEEQAVEVLREIAADLGIGQSFGQLNHIKERLDLHKAAFRLLQDKLKEEPIPDIKFLQNLRQETVHCHQELCDELSYDVNRLKIAFGDDRKSEVRSSILKKLWRDDDFKKENKANSISALKEIYSDDDEYKEWLACSTVSYGIWNDYRDTMKYINMFIDGVAAQIRTEQTNLRMDLK